MPYVMKRGTIYGKPYKCGDFVPGAKGTLADMEEAGAVEWVDAPVREPRKPDESQNVILRSGQVPKTQRGKKTGRGAVT